jgi:hypothetical protein
LTDPLADLKRLSQQPFLATLPLVTLTPEITQAANQIPGLAVFPCLAPLTVSVGSDGEAKPSALLQVFQVASGIGWTPHILLVDLATLAVSPADPAWGDAAVGTTEAPTIAEWLKASAQYLQTAGFQTSISTTWTQVLHHLHHQSVDLLLWVRHPEPHPYLTRTLQTLAQLEARPPILVWQDPLHPEPATHETRTYTGLLEAIATQVLPPAISMQELLEQIQQNLGKR